MIFHLRVLIKSLLEEVEKIKVDSGLDITLDEGILELLRKQVIDGVDVDAILRLYRPLPKIIEVEKLIDRPVYINGTLEKGVPVRAERCVIAEAFT